MPLQQGPLAPRSCASLATAPRAAPPSSPSCSNDKKRPTELLEPDWTFDMDNNGDPTGTWRYRQSVAVTDDADDCDSDKASLRCLDPSHPAVCPRCRAAPTSDELNGVKLHSNAGPRAGEQRCVRLWDRREAATIPRILVHLSAHPPRLRHLLLATPEWNNPAAREALAAKLEAEGDHHSARVLRDRDAPSLRKPSMCALARGWGYRCDVFRCRTERAEPAFTARNRSRRGAAAAANQAPALTPFYLPHPSAYPPPNSSMTPYTSPPFSLGGLAWEGSLGCELLASAGLSNRGGVAGEPGAPMCFESLFAS